MQLFDYNDLLTKNRETEKAIQRQRADNKELLSRIAEEKKARFSVMRNDFNKAGEFLNEMGSENAYEFKISMLNLPSEAKDISTNFNGTAYSLETILISIKGDVKVPVVTLYFSRNGKAAITSETRVPDSNYSGTMLTIDAVLLDSLLLRWEEIRPAFSELVRECGEAIIEAKQKKIDEESAKIDDVNHQWIEHLKKKVEPAA